MFKGRIRYEKETSEKMIQLYCRHHHIAQKGQLCMQCAMLLSYTHSRLDGCTFGEYKPSCKNCTIHCFKPSMRNEIKQVMRFSGSRMIWHYPLTSFKVLFNKWAFQRNNYGA